MDMAAERPSLSFTVAEFDNEHLPLPENSVDVVICNQVYEHVPRPEQLIRNIHRVLRPGGVCYFAGPNLLWPVEPHVHWPLVHWLPRGAAMAIMQWLGSSRTGDLDAYSVTAWTLERWLHASGFDLRSAVRDRLAAQPGEAVADRLARMFARLPRWVFDFTNPVLPGFVYLLRKPDSA
jgi:SAM-dependent methyltransferase